MTRYNEDLDYLSLNELVKLKNDTQPFKDAVVKSAFEDYETRILCTTYERLHLVLSSGLKSPDFDKEVVYFLSHICNEPINLAEYYLLMLSIEYLFYEAPDDERNLFMVVELIEAGKKDNPDYDSDLDRLFDMLKKKNAKHVALSHYESFRSAAGENVNDIVKSCRKHFYVIGRKGHFFKYINSSRDIEFLTKIITKTYDKNNADSYHELYDILNNLYKKSQGKPVRILEIKENLKALNALQEFYKGTYDDDVSEEDKEIFKLLLVHKNKNIPYDDSEAPLA